MKRLILISLIAVLALVAAGCGVVTQNISGRGSVQLLYGEIAGGEFVPGEATFSLNFACYAQNNNRIQGSLKWNDPNNGVRVSATLPETSVSEFTGGQFTTCKAMKAAAADLGYSMNMAGIYSQDGNADGDAGTLTGWVGIVVSQPGLGGEYNPCGPTGTVVLVEVGTVQEGAVYDVGGCLDRGKIIWGGTQNQQ